MNRITFDQPKPIEEVKGQYDIKRVSILTTPNLYPLVKGIEFDGNTSSILSKRKVFPIKRKMDAHIATYENTMLRDWKAAKAKIKSLINKVKDISKLDYNNKLTILRIAKIPTEYKQQFIDVADKYDLNLAILDKIVLNSSLMVNARYDSRANLMEFNPDYLKQHGMIRIGDSGEWISETAKTFIHEFAHAFWYNSLTEEDRRHWSGLATFLTRDKLTGDMSQYLVGEKKRFDGSTMYSSYYTLRPEPFVSVYARFNTREDWAESFLYYKVAPKTLERMVPNKYAFINEKIGRRIEKETIAKFAPMVDNPKELRDQIISILDKLKDDLSYKAKDAYQRVYNLGRQKGAYYTGNPFDNKLTVADKEKLQQLYERNDGYLDEFMDDLSEEYDDVLFDLTPTGFIEGIKEYDDIDEFDQEFEDVMDTQEHRLGSFAMAGLGVVLMAGMIAETEGAEPGTEVIGGYWHTSADDRVCDDCERLDGQWMTYDEFEMLYQHNECNIGCRCEELFEPAPAPGDYQGINIYGTPADDIDLTMPEMAMERMVKGGPGSGKPDAYGGGSKDESRGSREPKGSVGYRSGSAEDYAESLSRHQSGRSTGHFGSGTYFFSSEDKAKDYEKGTRGIAAINLEGKLLYKPKDVKEGKELHETMKTLNNASFNEKHWDYQGQIGYKPDYELWSNKLGRMGIKVSPKDIKDSMDEVYSLARKGKFPKEDTTSTRIMKRAGYDGVDVRHIPELDNSEYGSVLYRKQANKMLKYDNKIVAVDYHGTLMIDGKVNEGLKTKLQEMKNEGYHIIIHTSGITANPGTLNGIQTWLTEQGVPYDEIWQRQGKPDADIYIDDKAVNPNKEDITQLEV